MTVKIFDFKCDFGHTTEELFRNGEDIPDAIPCEECLKEGRKAMMQRVIMYPVAGFNLPTSSGTY